MKKSTLYYIDKKIREKKGDFKMSVYSKVRLKGFVTCEEILNFLVQKVDQTAKKSIDTIPCHDYDSVSGTFYFTKEGKILSIFYYYTSLNLKENYDYWVEKGLKDMVDTHTTELLANVDESSVNVMRMIVEHFGGWIDENDSDGRYYEPVTRNSDGTIKPVFRVTMEDIYEKFGGIVIIEN